MTKVLRRLFLGALLLLIASGVLSGVFVASGESPSQGAQVISVGALTHSVKAFDISMKIKKL